LKLYYDLHIHSALSPCADNDMTPNNIVNMALIKGLDVIAVTDHNSCGNVRAVLDVAKSTPLVVVPAIEIETYEEVHVLAYFKTIISAQSVAEIIRSHASGILNSPDIFGDQYYMDSKDNIVASEKALLVSACKLSLKEVFDVVLKAGGVAVPAHIDKSSYSLVSNLGFIPSDISVNTVEIRAISRKTFNKNYANYNIITNSDAHMLENISEKEFYFDLQNNTVSDIISYLSENHK